jgi:EmrB/QacA subfamily drug resistance transporter
VTVPTPTRGEPEPGGRRIALVFAGMMCGMLLAAMDQTIVAAAMPTILGELGGLTQLSWIVTAYMLASTAMVPLFGRLGDLYGRKRVYQAAIVIFLIGSALAGQARAMWMLVVARAIQGVGAGGLISLTQAIIADLVAPRQRGRYQGYMGAVFALASVVGSIAGGFLTDHLSWRWAFYINLPLGGLALAVIAVALDAPFVQRKRRLDLFGAGLLTAGVTAMLLALEWGGERHAWTSPALLGLLAAAAVLLAVFVAQQRRAPEPFLPLRLFRNRVVVVGVALVFFVGVAMFGVITFMPLMMQTVSGVSATRSGLVLLPMILGLTAASITSGRIITRTGRYRIFPIIGTTLLTIGFVVLSRLGPRPSTTTIAWLMGLLGVAMGNINQVVVLAVQNAVDPEDLGIATALASFSRSIGATIGVAALGAVLAARLAAALAHVAPERRGALSAQVLASPEQLRALPPDLADLARGIVGDALHAVFFAAIPVAAAAWVLSLFLRELPLRGRA